MPEKQVCIALLALVLLLVGCGADATLTGPPSPTAGPQPSAPAPSVQPVPPATSTAAGTGIVISEFLSGVLVMNNNWGEGPISCLTGTPAPVLEGGAGLEWMPAGKAGRVRSGDGAAGFVNSAPGASVTGSVLLTSPWTSLATAVTGYHVEASDWQPRAYGLLLPLAVEGGAIPIANTRALKGKRVTVESVATMYAGGYYAGGTGAKFYVEDETGGIQVYCPEGIGEVVVAVGDRVGATGKIDVYRGLMEILPATYPDDVWSPCFPLSNRGAR